MALGAPSPVESLTPFRISLVRTGAGAHDLWSAEVDGLPGCSATGATPEEAVRRAWAAAEGTLVQAGEDSSDEAASAKHSGRLLVRMPATLHDELARSAKREGVSLNQFITGALASAVEWRVGGRSHEGDRDEQRLTSRSLRIALIANLAAVLLATLVAITLLVAWRAGW